MSVIREALKRFQSQISQLGELKKKLENSDKKDTNAQQVIQKAVKKLELVIKGIQNLLEEHIREEDIIVNNIIII